MSLNNLKISRKLLLAFAVLIITFIVSSVFVFNGLASVRKRVVSSQEASMLSLDAAGAYAKLVEEAAAARGYIMSGDPKWLQETKQYADDFDKRISKFSEETSSSELRAEAKRLQTATAAWRANLDKAVELARNPATRSEAIAAGVQTTLKPLRDIYNEIDRGETAIRTERMKHQEQTLEDANFVLLVGGVVGVIVASLMAWLLGRSIATPVVRMTGVMGRLAGGDNSVEVPGVGRQDEIGQMAQAVVGFKEAAIEKLRVEDEAAKQREAAEAERARNEAAQRAAQEQQAHVVECLADGLKQLSEGNLVARIEEPFAGEYEKLRADFNTAIGRLQETMQSVLAGANGISTGAGEISQAADDLSQRTERQAASLEETAAALEEITATVKRTAENAQEARSIMGTAKTAAEDGGKVVETAVKAMSEIEHSSKQITEIIGVIDKIAFQTNLLALNAGVEAARAGDAGRGFAVVASEVRALAQRSSEAAKEIEALISASSGQVESGVKLVGETGEALRNIVNQVIEINTLVTEVAQAAQQQSTGIDEINAAVGQMDQVTQQNAAMVEEATAASRSLATETEELSRRVSFFHVGDGQAVRAEPVATKRADAKPRNVQPMPAKVSRAVGATHRNLALKASAQPQEDDWEEF